jgi:MFS family permease
VVVGGLVYAHTHDTLSLGLIGLAEALPMLCAILFGGYVADMVDRRKIVLFAASGFAACVVALIFISIHIESVIAAAGLLPVYAVIGVTGILRAFMAPSQSALNAQLVPRDQFVHSANWNSLAFDISSVSGPAIGGLLYGFFDAQTALTVVLGFALIGIFFFSRISPQPVAPRNSKENIWQSLGAGIRFVFSRQALVGTLALDMFAVLFGGAVSMLPAFAEILGVGPEGLGFLRAAPAMGAILVAFYIARYPPTKNAGYKMLFSVAAFGVCIILFALSRNFWLSMVLLALSGAFDGISVVVRATITQRYAPDDMRGRVESVNRIFIASSNEIGAFESGLAARILELVPSVVFGGCMTLLVVAVMATALPKLRRLQL